MKVSFVLIPVVLFVSNISFASSGSKILLNCYTKNSASGNSVTIVEEDGDIKISTYQWDGTVNPEPVITDASQRPNAKLEENKFYVAGSSGSLSSAEIQFGSASKTDNKVTISLGDPDKTVLQFKTVSSYSSGSPNGQSYHLVITSNNAKNLKDVLSTAGIKDRSNYDVCE
ncbi:MAG TPA: hypothetical protein VN132_11470 [Bdellovibrio sp.]|nr:hypothetical protein [Bdellovibrio sp.]